MKALRIMSIAVAICMALTACAQKRIFNNLPSGDGIEKVYVSGALLKLSGVQNYSNIPQEAVKSLDCIEVIECTKAATIKAVKDQLNSLIKSDKLEILMENDDGEDKNYIYGRTTPDGKFLDLMIIVSEEYDEYDVVALSGRFDINSLGGMM